MYDELVLCVKGQATVPNVEYGGAFCHEYLCMKYRPDSTAVTANKYNLIGLIIQQFPFFFLHWNCVSIRVVKYLISIHWLCSFVESFAIIEKTQVYLSG